MKKIVAILAGGLISFSAFSAGDAAAGKGKAAVCAACHGSNGISAIPIYPNLAGQKEAYIEKQLFAFKNGDRHDPTMEPMAKPLSDQDVKDLSAYFSSLPAGG